MSSYPWFTRRDLDGFFGLMVDNLVQLILIVSLGRGLVGLPDELLFGRILPGAALSILFGNLFYAWQARRLALREGRSDVTALPYGINTVSLFAFVLFIMAPIYRKTGDPELAWRVGLVACLVSGLIELGGAFVADRLRRVTPRAALLSALAGIAVSFIAMDFLFRIFEMPLVAMAPLAIILLQYFSRARFPLGLPGGMAAVAVGTALAWALGLMEGGLALSLRWAPPRPAVGELLSALRPEHLLGYMAVTVPMGLFNVVGSLQNVESAEAAGDRYPARAALAANGAGSLIAACFGSCFPTTIYIGHPGWKALGARAGYSTLNGFFLAFLCFTGTVGAVLRLVPLEAGIAILLWIGVVIVAQAFQATPHRHAPAVAVGLFPALAAWGLLLIQSALGAAGTDLHSLGEGAFLHRIPIRGLILLERGFLFSSMILSSISVFLIERDFGKAALWALAGAVLSFVGVIHAYEITPGGVGHRFGLGVAPSIAGGYLFSAALFAAYGLWARGRGDRGGKGEGTPPRTSASCGRGGRERR
ncbi:MAG: NCS2 family permease [Nitrospinota bacterium]